MAFAEVNFEHRFVPIRIATIVFAVDFLLRVAIGLDRSPVGVVSAWIARRRPLELVSARPKRFAWTLGLLMSAPMAVITNPGVHGVLPRTICLVCLALMSLESVLGLCLGFEIPRRARPQGLGPQRRRVRDLRRGSVRPPLTRSVAGPACRIALT